MPSGMSAASRLTVTGLVVVVGSTTSAMVNEPVGAAGAATPATEPILRLGAFGKTTDVGDLVDTTLTVDVPRLTADVLLKASPVAQRRRRHHELAREALQSLPAQKPKDRVHSPSRAEAAALAPTISVGRRRRARVTSCLP